MNHCAIQKNSFAACEEMMGGAAVGCRSEMRETVVCPKPRRLGLIHATLNETSYVRPLRWHASHHQDVCDAKAGNELLDIILAKGKLYRHPFGLDLDYEKHSRFEKLLGGGCGADQSATPIASSPPFFSGSPPSRVSNPLIQDVRFGNDEFTPVSPRAIPTPSGLAPSPSSTRKGGCVRANFGNNPAVRVEGFDCLDRDRRNCSIPTLA